MFIVLLSTLFIFTRGDYVGAGGYGGKGWRDPQGSHDADTMHHNGMTPSQFVQYCRVDSDFITRHGIYWKMAQTNWSTALTIYVVLGTDDSDMEDVVTIPYIMLMNYNEAYCRFEFTLAWYAACDANLCPLVTPGLWMSIQQTFVNIGVPTDVSSKNCELTTPRYYQTYPTPSAVGNPDQNVWIEKHFVSANQSSGWYQFPDTQKTVYEETISWARDDPPFRQYSNQQYAPSFNNPGKRQMIWVYGASDGIGKNITEPQNSVLNMYFDGSLPLVQYAPGKSSYMKLIAPSTGKRVNAQYDSIFTAMQKWQQKGLIKLGA
jgi:hypothetical protein